MTKSLLRFYVDFITEPTESLTPNKTARVRKRDILECRSLAARIDGVTRILHELPFSLFLQLEEDGGTMEGSRCNFYEDTGPNTEITPYEKPTSRRPVLELHELAVTDEDGGLSTKIEPNENLASRRPATALPELAVTEDKKVYVKKVVTYAIRVREYHQRTLHEIAARHALVVQKLNLGLTEHPHHTSTVVLAKNRRQGLAFIHDRNMPEKTRSTYEFFIQTDEGAKWHNCTKMLRPLPVKPVRLHPGEKKS